MHIVLSKELYKMFLTAKKSETTQTLISNRMDKCCFLTQWNSIQYWQWTNYCSCHRMDKSQKCMLNMKVSLKRLSAQCDSVIYNSNSSNGNRNQDSDNSDRVMTGKGVWRSPVIFCSVLFNPDAGYWGEFHLDTFIVAFFSRSPHLTFYLYSVFSC